MPDRKYGAGDITDVYRRGIQSIRDAIKLFDYRNSEGAGINGANQPWVSASLFAEVLSRGPSEFFLIDTVGKAGRWGIGVVGARVPRSLTDEHLRTACDNAAAWEKDELSRVNDERFTDLTPSERARIEPRNGGVQVFRYVALRRIVYCAVLPMGQQDNTVDSIYIELGTGFDKLFYPSDLVGGGRRLSPWAIYPANTPLVQIH